MAGIVYHNLGVKFCSPTINLFITGEDYLAFVRDLRFYLSREITEKTAKKEKYPVGRIDGDEFHKSIDIHFLHYESFKQAKDKWTVRAKRINWNNLYFVWEFHADKYDIALLKEFDDLPIRKMCIVHEDMPEIHNKCIIRMDNAPGRLFEYDGLTGKKHLDKFDYVSFLNGEAYK